MKFKRTDTEETYFDNKKKLRKTLKIVKDEEKLLYFHGKMNDVDMEM